MSGLNTDDRVAVEQAADAYLAAMNAADWERVARSFSEDGVRIPPNEEPHQGREAIKGWLGGIQELTGYELSRDEVGGSDGIAYVRGQYQITLRPMDAPAPISDQGDYQRSGAKGLTAPGASSRRSGNTRRPRPA